MNSWMGLDTGGTEQLWEPSLLVGALSIFKANEPFSRADHKSPLYADLHYSYPEITWSSFDENGSFRPVFRKTNPWVKLGLIEAETWNASLTPRGDELLSGEKSISEIFTEALKNHREMDAVHSFGLMCFAATLLPEVTFTLEDVEYGIANLTSYDASSISDLINNVRSRALVFPAASRRPRTLRSFMNALVSAGALVNAPGGWQLNNKRIASEIANLVSEPAAYIPYSVAEIRPAKIISDSASSIQIIKAGTRATPLFNAAFERRANPEQTALLFEKANSIHESLVELCANVVRSFGWTPVEDASSFDVAVIEKEVILEIKSINKSNVISQLRKAVAQLPEYRWKHRKIFSEKSSLLVIVDKDPSIFIGIDYVRYLEGDRGIGVFWLERTQFVNTNNDTLQSYFSSLK